MKNKNITKNMEEEIVREIVKECEIKERLLFKIFKKSIMSICVKLRINIINNIFKK